MPVTVKEASDNKIEVIGEHDGKEIVILDSDKDGWNVGFVRAFPNSIEQAEAYLAVYNEVFDKMREIRASRV
jgi:hypothetical protein